MSPVLFIKLSPAYDSAGDYSFGSCRSFDIITTDPRLLPERARGTARKGNMSGLVDEKQQVDVGPRLTVPLSAKVTS
jgi:hypothetical protein